LSTSYLKFYRSANAESEPLYKTNESVRISMKLYFRPVNGGGVLPEGKRTGNSDLRSGLATSSYPQFLRQFTLGQPF